MINGKKNREKVKLICFVSLFSKENNKWILPERAEGIIHYFLKKNHKIFLIKLDKNIGNNFFEDALLINQNEIVKIDIRTLDCIYFNYVGKGISKLNIESCLNNELEYFTKFLDFIIKNNVIKPLILNPVNTLINNISKNYYFEFKKKLPFLKTIKIDCVEQLLSLSKKKEIFIAKPLISERSKGTVILNDMNENEIIEYFYKYNNYYKQITDFNKKNDLYKNIMLEQKIIVQPFCNSFSKEGEKKIAIINGEICYSRRIKCIKDGIIPNFYKGTSIDIFYEPNDKEKEFCKKVYKIFNEIYPINYMRLDFVNDKDNFLINEIEVINPDWAEIDNLVGIDKKKQEKLVNNLRSKIYKMIINCTK